MLWVSHSVTQTEKRPGTQTGTVLVVTEEGQEGQAKPHKHISSLLCQIQHYPIGQS